MNKLIFRRLAFAVVLGSAILLSGSFGAREMGGQSTFRTPARTFPAQRITTYPGPVFFAASSLWARTYGLFHGGPGFTLDEYDSPYAVQRMGEGRFVVAGEADSKISEDAFVMDAAVVELDLQGNVRWKALFPFSRLGPPSAYQCGVYAITQSRDGGCLAVGYVAEPGLPVLVMNISADGMVRWVRSYWTGLNNTLWAVVTATSDGGYAVAAQIWSPEYVNSIWVFKLDSLGTVVWSEVFASGWESESIRAIRGVSDGGLVLAGTHSETGDGTYQDRAWVMRLDSGGGLEWHKCYATTPGVNESTTAGDITPAKDGGFALTGSVQLSGSSSKTWVCKLNSSGDIKWQKTYNGSSGSAIIQTSDGGYLVTGGDSARAFKLTPSGAVQWAKKYDRPLKSEKMLGVFEKEGGGYVMIARSEGIWLNPAFFYRPWIAMSVDKNGDIAPGCPFVRSIVGDARTSTVHLSSDSFSRTSSTPMTHALAFNPQGKPSIRVGANACR